MLIIIEVYYRNHICRHIERRELLRKGWDKPLKNWVVDLLQDTKTVRAGKRGLKKAIPSLKSYDN